MYIAAGIRSAKLEELEAALAADLAGEAAAWGGRWLLHNLAAAYRLQSESLDEEPQRSVRMIRTAASAIPSVSLSSATRALLSASTGGSGAGVRGLDEALQLHLSGLSVFPSLSAHDVRRQLHDWEGAVQLHWLDDDHLIVLLSEPGLRPAVRQRLLTLGLWTDDAEQSAAAEADGRLCLQRKLRLGSSGGPQAAVRERDRKRLVTGSDGFTAVVTVRGGAAAAEEAGRPATLPDPRQHSGSSDGLGETAEEPRSSAAAQRQSTAAVQPVAAVGLQSGSVPALRGGNRWAALMDAGDDGGGQQAAQQPDARLARDRVRGGKKGRAALEQAGAASGQSSAQQAQQAAAES